MRRAKAAALHQDHLSFAARFGAAIDPGGHLHHVWSPYSVATALALLAIGARTATRAELEQLLGDPTDHLAALDEAVRDGAELATNTGLWVSDTAPLEPAFAASLRDRPDTGVYNADFAHDAAEVRNRINADVAATTRGLIPRLLGPGDVTPETLAVLVNALWVRMRWTVPFSTSRTRRDAFHTPSGVQRVPTMHRQGRMGYAQTEDWHMATLPGQDALALDVILPRQSAGEDRPLTARDITDLQGAVKTTEVRLALPRFELTWTGELSEALTACGVARTFRDDADLSGISARRLKLQKVIHQATLTVDEEGAVGAAATGVVAVAARMPQRPVDFVVDRPFHFVLRRGGAILFLGTVTTPKDPGPAKPASRNLRRG